MISIITTASKFRSAAGLIGMLNPKNPYAAPVIATITVLIGGCMVASFKAMSFIVDDITERIIHHEEEKAKSTNSAK